MRRELQNIHEPSSSPNSSVQIPSSDCDIRSWWEELDVCLSPRRDLWRMLQCQQRMHSGTTQGCSGFVAGLIDSWLVQQVPNISATNWCRFPKRDRESESSNNILYWRTYCLLVGFVTHGLKVLIDPILHNPPYSTKPGDYKENAPLEPSCPTSRAHFSYLDEYLKEISANKLLIIIHVLTKCCNTLDYLDSYARGIDPSEWRSSIIKCVPSRYLMGIT